MILEALKCSELTREELKDVCRQNGMAEPEESSMFDQLGAAFVKCASGFINYVVQEKKCYEYANFVEDTIQLVIQQFVEKKLM